MNNAVYGNTIENLRNRIEAPKITIENRHQSQVTCRTKYLTMI